MYHPPMRRLLLRVAPYLHLTRVTSGFAVVANAWLVVLWTHGHPEEVAPDAAAGKPLWLLLLGGAVSAIGLYSFSVCLNDVLDQRRDRSLRPERPIAAGQVRLDAAVSLVAITLIMAVLGATVFGTQAIVLTLVLAMATLAYNAAARFIPGVGLVLLGLIYAGHMLVPNVQLRFLWPVWLVLTHTMAVAAVRHALARKVPPISRRAVVAALLGWALWSVVLLSLGLSRQDGDRLLWPQWVSPWAGVLPALLAVIFVVMAARRVRSLGPTPRAAEKVGRYGSVWLTLYAWAWLAGSDLDLGAWILAVLALVGILGMTTLREWYNLVENPVGYRRI